MSFTTAFLGAAIQLLTLLAPQSLPRTAPAFDQHVRIVRAERTERLRQLYATASPEGKADVERLLAERLSPGAPLGSRPPLGAIDEAVRVLGGSPADSVLHSLADALDMMVTPGAFSAASDGRGEALTVRLYPVYPARAASELEVRLWWVGTDGMRVRARTERVAPEAFRRPGFDVFVRAPLGPPALWSLEAELHDPVTQLTVPGPSVRIAGVENLVPRLSGLIQGASRDVASRAATAALRREVGAGLRRIGPALPSLLRNLEQAAEGAATPGPVPLFEVGADPSDPDVLPLGWFQPAPEEPEEPEQSAGLWLLLTPSQEAPIEAFQGTANWSHQARAAGAALLSISVGLERGERAVDRVHLARRLAANRTAPVILILRGDTIARLRFSLLAGDELAVDGIVVSGEGRVAAPLGLALPTLFVLPDLPGGSTVDRGELDLGGAQVMRRGASSFLAEPQLPAIVAEWASALPRSE